MARIFSAVLLVLLAWLPMGRAAADDFAAWSHSAPVEISGEGKYKALFLMPEVYAHAAANLADLRLVDSAGKQVPFYIQGGEVVRRESESVIAARLTDSFQGGDDSYFEYRLATDDNTDPLGNRLVFKLPAGVFVKHIEIYGSYDGVKWQLLARDYLYRVDGREKKEATLGGERKFRHYRIRVLDNAEKVALPEMSLVSRKAVSNWARYEQTARLAYAVEVNGKDRQTVITVENPDRLRLKQLVLEVDDNFQRSYSAFTDAKAAHPAQTGEIYNLRFAGVAVDGRAIRFRTVPVTDRVVIKIDDRDDRPLAIRGIESEYYVDKLVFPDLGDKPYRLYFGNAKAEAPRYELGQQRGYIEKENQDECRLTAVEANQKTAPVWLPIKSEYLFNAAIVAVSLLLVIVMVPKISSRK